MQRKTNESPVAAHFNLTMHTVEDLTIMVIDQLFDQDSTPENYENKDIDQSSEYFVPMRNEPQS